MWKSKVIFTLLAAVLVLSGCNIQTVQQFENEQKEQSEKVIVTNAVDETKQQQQEQEKKIAPKTTSEIADDKAQPVEPNKLVVENQAVEEKKSAETKQQEVVETLERPFNEQQPTVKAEVVEPQKKPSVKENQTAAVQQKPDAVLAKVKPVKESKKEQEKEVTAAEKPKVEAKPGNSIKKEQATENPTPAPKPVAPKPVEKEEKIEYVYVSIGLKVLLIKENYDKLPSALQNPKYVPSNGVISNQIKVKYEKGDTAWDAILQVRNKFGVNIAYRNNPLYGIYIEGINHVYEKDAGEMSGWMYAVNGVKAPVGVSNYSLMPNDQIQLQYSLNQGVDLGW